MFDVLKNDGTYAQAETHPAAIVLATELLTALAGKADSGLTFEVLGSEALGLTEVYLVQGAFRTACSHIIKAQG